MDKIVQSTETTVNKAIDFYNDVAQHAKLAAIDDIKNPMTKLIAISQEYVDAAKTQLSPYTTSDAVAKAKKAFSEKLQVKLDLIHTRVKESGNAVLLELVEKPMSFIMKATKGEATINALIIIEALEKNLDPLLLNKLTKADTDQLRALLKAYDDIKDLPLEARDKKKVKGTNVLKALDKKAKDIIKDLKITIKGNFADDTTLRDGFLAALTIPDPPTKSNSAKIILLDEDGNPFTEAAKALDTKSNAKVTPSFKANSNGIILIPFHKLGKFPFKLVIKGKPDQIVIIEFLKGEMVVVTVTVKD